ncbi:MAG: efflux RND transporter periplasmic adaptor subunit [Verrucomicrobia bacterium]|nr:efflux RND transporter periplasmic adaptor subunit [Verrucomicrobiota bacterium]
MKKPFTKLLAVVLSTVAFVGCKPGGQEENDKVVTEVAVQVGKLTRATLHRYVTAYGIVEPEPARDGKPSAGARLAPPVAGIVAEVNCAEGQRVEKGTVLFRLDSRPVDVAVQFAKQTYERQKKLLPVGGTSQKALQEAEQQLAAARAQQALLRIEAPLAGVITRVNARPGEAADLTSVLGELVDTARLVATASVPAGEMDGLKAGQSVEFINEGKPLTARGAVAFISPQVDTKTGAALLRASVPANAGLRPGQYVNLRIVSEERAGRLAVPVESVVTDVEGHSVIALVEGDKATQKSVKAGLRDGGLVEVEGEGLKEGDTVVTVGAYGLPKETKVRVVKP